MTKEQFSFIKLVKSLNNLGSDFLVSTDGMEIRIMYDGCMTRFFYHKNLDTFIILKSTSDDINISDLKFNEKITRKLKRLIDYYIKSKINNHGNKPYRVIRKGTKDKYKK